jgi:UDP-glucuronate 4-epimerase
LREKILVTGAAGFIGFHVARRLLQEGYCVIGLDNLNDYYDVKLKKDRLTLLKQPSFIFSDLSLEDNEGLMNLFQQNQPSIVIHLAAQAGVKYCLKNPQAYINSNLVGFGNVLEGCKKTKVEHLLYASSSSVYGANQKFPFSVQDHVDHPLTLYAATKRANELMAHAYSYSGLPTTGMRFFNVYGPWGRPDMALFIFTKAILENKPIHINNYGNMFRDFTYIDDVVECIIRLMHRVPKPRDSYVPNNPSQSKAPYQIHNIGNQTPIHLMEFISIIEEKLGKKAIKRFLPVQPEEVFKTFADVNELQNTIQFYPNTSMEQGIERFLDWYFRYYQNEQQPIQKAQVESRFEVNAKHRSI